MIPIDTLRTIARQLLTKARAGQVVWAREEGKITGLKERPFEYVLRLPQSQVRLRHFKSATAPNNVVMRVCDPSGTEFGQWLVEEGEDDWELMSALYAEADRLHGGWDIIVHDIEKAVATEGPIGQR
jgi:hypothetical protein